MFISIDTINQLLFPLFLFLLYVCVISLILYKGEPSSSQATPLRMNRANSGEFNQKPLAEEETSTDISPSSSQQQLLLSQRTELIAQVETIIEQLTKRVARSLCRPLSIQQKTNGIEKSLDLMKAAIRREFKKDPDKTIAVIRARFPGFFAQATTSEPWAS